MEIERSQSVSWCGKINERVNLTKRVERIQWSDQCLACSVASLVQVEGSKVKLSLTAGKFKQKLGLKRIFNYLMYIRSCVLRRCFV